MTKVGASTACYYPTETEQGLQKIAEAGIRDTEIHLGTFSELGKEYLKELGRVARYYGTQIHAVHPFYTVLESAMFFSDYHERRIADGLEIYKQYFHATAYLGGKYLLFHGGSKFGKTRCMVSDDEYMERYHLIFECGKSFGVTLLHENVYTHVAENIDFCRKMIEYLGDDALFTFDNKQARRSGYTSVEFAKALSGHIRHIHISDCDTDHDCLLPGRGSEDFSAIQAALSGGDETACWLIEVYHEAFRSAGELKQSVSYLQSVLSRRRAEA